MARVPVQWGIWKPCICEVCAVVLGVITYAARSVPAQILPGTATGILLAAAVWRRCAGCGLTGTTRLLPMCGDHSGGLLYLWMVSAAVSDDTRSSVQGPEFTSPSLPKPAHWPVIRWPVGPIVSWIAPW